MVPPLNSLANDSTSHHRFMFNLWFAGPLFSLGAVRLLRSSYASKRKHGRNHLHFYDSTAVKLNERFFGMETNEDDEALSIAMRQ